MKRIVYTAGMLAIAACLVLGCMSTRERAQKLYNAGRYEEVVARYGNEPSAEPVVEQAKEKIAERWYAEKRYQAVIDYYPDTHAAMMARTEMKKDSTADRSALEQPKQGAVYANKEAAATAEYQRIKAIDSKDERMKALREFAMDPKYEGTSAQELAHNELHKK